MVLEKYCGCVWQNLTIHEFDQPCRCRLPDKRRAQAGNRRDGDGPKQLGSQTPVQDWLNCEREIKIWANAVKPAAINPQCVQFPSQILTLALHRQTHHLASVSFLKTLGISISGGYQNDFMTSTNQLINKGATEIPEIP